jgi:hypothetical protein
VHFFPERGYQQDLFKKRERALHPEKHILSSEVRTRDYGIY